MFRCTRCGLGVHGYPDAPPPSWFPSPNGDPEEWLCEDCGRAWRAEKLKELS